MMKRRFETRFELDEFVDKLIDNGHYGEFIVKFENGLWTIYW